VSKQSGQNTVAAADALKDRIKQIQAALPKDIHIQVINDQSISSRPRYIRSKSI
jgi:HAE1 family hydrophobic/amphiphilic exporter-1